MKKYLLILLLICIFLFNGCQKSATEIKDIERSFEGLSPYQTESQIMLFYTGNTIEFEGEYYATLQMNINSYEPISEEHAKQVESRLDGVFCGGGVYEKEISGLEFDNYYYYFCFNKEIQSVSELFLKVDYADDFWFIDSASAYKMPKVAQAN